MKTRRTVVWVMGLTALAILVFLGCCCLVAVDETEYAVVTSFGKIVAVHGVEPGTAGLHYKSPWQSVLRVDHRLRAFDPPPREVITGDKRNLEVASYLIYRVADPVQFVRGSGSLDQAEARLSERVAAALSDAIGRRDLAVLATTDSGAGVDRGPDWRSAPGRRPSDTLGAGDRSRRSGPAPVQPSPGSPPGGLRADPQRAPAGGRKASGRGRGPVHHDHQPGRPDARHAACPGRRRGGADSRPGPGRVHANSQRGPCPRSPVLRAAPHARIVRRRFSIPRRRSCSHRPAPC